MLTRRSLLAAGALFPFLPADTKYQLGYATITWGARLEQALDDISAAGYSGIQFRSPEWEKNKDDPGAFQAQLDARKLKCVAMSGGNVDLLPEKRAEYISRSVAQAKFLKAIGAPYLQVLDALKPPFPEDAAVSLATLLNEIGKRVADEGVRLGYHNHMNSYSERPDDARRLFDRLDAKFCGLIFDTAHCKQGGGDPVKMLADYGGKLLYPHFKDHYSGPPKKVGTRDVWFTELGQGDLDFPGVLAQMSKHGYKGWIVVELDVYEKVRTERESAELSMKYLRATL